MNKILLLLLVLMPLCIQAQVTIGVGEAANNSALLELRENTDGTSNRGLLLPRVKLSSLTLASPLPGHVNGMTVFNIDGTNIPEGLYYNDGTRWIQMVPQNAIFFYAPSIVLPTSVDDPAYNKVTETFTIDMYNVYKSQFGMSDLTSSTKSPLAGALPVLKNSELDYFVTYYDNKVFTTLAISNTGVLTYKLITGFTITANTFINIVFKVR